MDNTLYRDVADLIEDYFETQDASEGQEMNLADLVSVLAGKVPFPATRTVVLWMSEPDSDVLVSHHLEVGRNRFGRLVVTYRPLDLYKVLLRKCQTEAVGLIGEIPVELVKEFLTNFSTLPFRWRRQIQRDLDKRHRVAVANGTLVTAQVLQTLIDAVETFVRKEVEAQSH